MRPIKAFFGGAQVDFIDRAGSDSSPTPGATCIYSVLTGGTESLTGVSNRQWLLRGLSSAYQIFAHINSGPGVNGTTAGSSAFDTWLTANTSPAWLVQRTGAAVGASVVVLAMQCRRVSDSVVIDSWTITLSASVV